MVGEPAVGVVILAAGASTRMGTPKQLLPYRGRSLLRHAAETALTSVCHPIIVVLGANAERLRQEVKDLPVQVVENLRWVEGMSSSIRAGVAALDAEPDKTSAVVLALCDQPFVSAQVINHLVEAYHFTGKPVVASEYSGTLGVPALFSRTLFSEIKALRGGEGAKQVITKYAHDVLGVPFPEGAIDVDTPKDYEQFRSMVE